MELWSWFLWRPVEMRKTVCIGVLVAVGLIIGCAELHANDGAEKAEPDKEPEFETTVSLDSKVDIKLEDIEIADAATALTERTGLNIVADSTISRPLTLTTSIRLVNVPLRDALKAVLRTVGLDFAVTKNFIFVSTPDRIRTMTFEVLETRVYTLKGDMGESLPKIILMNPATGPQGPGY